MSSAAFWRCDVGSFGTAVYTVRLASSFLYVQIFTILAFYVLYKIYLSCKAQSPKTSVILLTAMNIAR